MRLFSALFVSIILVTAHAKAQQSAMNVPAASGLSTSTLNHQATEEHGLAADYEDIEDNSFLIEEAFNQDPGVEQHIQTYQLMADKSFLYTFTEESPVGGRDHQLSVTVPFLGTAENTGAQSGLGDIAANYRYQLLNGPKYFVSPRLTLLTGSGDFHRGLGYGAVGYQLNVPLSVKILPRLISHWNVGSTFVPQRKSAGGESFTTVTWNYGASLIWLATYHLNFMLEIAGLTDQVPIDNALTLQTSLFINPGIRYAFNFRSGLQIVPGLSAPIGAGSAAGQYGVLTYLSFEHPMF
jgi:hypothetical protein